MCPSQSQSADGRLPVTLITGFLGSGKTTLVNHLLASCRGRRIAVLVNEIGEIAIDGELLQSAAADMVELGNGCICCSINNELVDAIFRVLQHDPPVDHLIVETTGLADPLPSALTFVRPEFSERIRLDSIIATADADQFSLDLFRSGAARNQLRYADLILLNKCDIVGSEQVSAVEAKIRAVRQDARILRTTHARVPLPLIMDVDRFDRELCFHASAAHQESHDHLTLDGFGSLGFEADRPFALDRFQDFLNTKLAANIFRGKGLLWLDRADSRYVFHLVGGRFSLDRGPWIGTRRNRLTLIGRNLDQDGLRAALEQCLVATEDTPPSR